MAKIQQHKTRPEAGFWKQIRTWMHKSAPVWGIASLVVIVVLFVSIAVLRSQVNQLTSGLPEDMQIVALTGTQNSTGATGTIVISADGEYGTIVVDRLQPLDEKRQYQLWLIQDSQRTSGGVFLCQSTWLRHI
jgi:hypothetical protein